MNCQQLKANKRMYQILMIMLNDFQYNCQKKLFLVCYWWRENKSLETAPDHNFSPLKSLKHSMSSDLQHINTTVLMEIVGPSHSVVILYMNQTWCWTPAVAVLMLSSDLLSCAAQSISWLYGTTPAGLQSLLLVLSISCASRWGHNSAVGL